MITYKFNLREYNLVIASLNVAIEFQETVYDNYVATGDFESANKQRQSIDELKSLHDRLVAYL